MKRKYFTFLFCMMSLLSLAQCGDDDAKSKQVKFRLNPKSPVVIKSNITINEGQDNELIVNGPWFLFGSSVYNGSDSMLTLVNYQVTIGAVINGIRVNSPPAVLAINSSCEDEDDFRNYMAVIPSGRTYRGLTDPCDETTITSDAEERWYIGSLATADTFTYNVTVDGEGWFENDSGEAIERLVITAGMSTR